MKITILAALLLVCGIGSVKSQSSVNNLKIVSNKQLASLHFIDNISFTHEVSGVPSINTTRSFNTYSLNPITEVIADVKEITIEKLSSTQFKYAMMMDVEVETLINPALYSFIDEWYGTNYRMGGTTKKGIDCSAFSGALLSNVFSFTVPRTAREQYKVCEQLKNKDELLPGDLVFFNTRGGVSHVGVYLTNSYFVHSSSSNGVTISSLNDDYYSRKFISGGRVNQ